MPFHAITTELERNSVLCPLTTLEQDGAIRLSVVPFTDTSVDLAEIKKAICEDTCLVVMTHGSNVFGSVQDIRPIAEYLHANDIFFIMDGAQTTGHIPVVSFDIADIDNHEAGFILTRACTVITRTGLHYALLIHERIDNGKGCIRVSFSYFNTCR